MEKYKRNIIFKRKKAINNHSKANFEKNEIINSQIVRIVPYTDVVKKFNSFNANPVIDSIWAMGCPLLWSYGDKGKGAVVGVIDTGIDDTHPALKGKVYKRVDYVRDGRPTTNFASHGSHVAGTIAANGLTFKGVAPEAILHDYRVLDINGSGYLSNVTRAINDAVRDGCHILDLSLGGPTTDIGMHSAIKNAVNKGVLVVVAAGNSGPNQISYPANYPEVVSVGAIQFDATNGTLTTPEKNWFSNTNPQVDVCSDGFEVYSCVPNNAYGIKTGTSMAAPHVSGFAALLRNRMTRKLKRAPTEKELYTELKISTVETNVLPGNLIGAGFVTIYPELPQKTEQGDWWLPGLQLRAP